MNNRRYTTKQVLKRVQIARTTLYKWLKDGKVPEVCRDRNHFRLFTYGDIERLIRYKNRIYKPTNGRIIGRRAHDG